TQTATFTFTSPAKAEGPYVLPANFPNVSYNSTDGTYTFSLTTPTNGSFYFPNLPYGTAYEVSETTSGGRWQLWDQTDISGTLTGDATATFTNRQKPSLTIKKTVTGDGGSTTDYFDFTLELTDAQGNDIENLPAPYLLDENGNPTVKKVEEWNFIGSGNYSFKLKHGEWFRIDGLPIGAMYGLTEVDPSPYTTTLNITGDKYTDDHGTPRLIEFDPGDLLNPTVVDTYLSEDTTIEYINHRDRDKLTISKTVTGYGDPNKDWTFTVTLVDQDGAPLTNITAPTGATGWDDSGKSNGVYKFTLKHGESLTITMPTVFTATEHTKFTVSEAEADQGGYTTTLDFTSLFGSDTGALADVFSTNPGIIAGDTVVAFKNDKQTLNLKIGKTVAGNMGDKTREFEFMIKLEKPSTDPNAPMVPITGLSAPQGATAWRDLGNGEYSFKLKHGDSFTILGLPYGTRYSVVEIQPIDGYYDTTFDVDKRSLTEYYDNVYIFDPPPSTESPPPPTYRAVVSDVITEDVTITYTNTKGSTPPTGIYDSLGPALAGFVTATMLLAVSRIGRRRRRNE
ncbi:MAG: hypothetical protein IKI49_02765, partial [Oscillospiraceae bacterium]|nr:hypothetical protein [Oscillospiraceae bacterium]